MMITYVLLWIYNIHCIYGNPVVEIKYGSVEGTSIPIHTGHIIDSYLNIPYAKPPIGDLRFEPAQEPEPWDGTYLAKHHGNACMQYPSAFFGPDNSTSGYPEDEDCLNLNIYTPQRITTDLLPVFVWIHGGGYQVGVNYIYQGYFLSAMDVVYVALNYRLGIFGFASTSDEVVPGNTGLFDMVLALQFVQENIEAFGGDPNRVTIAGESAGGASVGLLLMSPLATGLFHNAILQSGSELHDMGLHLPAQNTSNYVMQVAEQHDCPIDASAEMIDCLKVVPAEELAATTFNCTDGYLCGGFKPVIDGVFLPDYPSALRARGEYNKVPEIIGFNDKDASIFVWARNLWIGRGLTREEYDEMIYRALERVAPSWPDPSRLDDAAQAVRFYYADYPNFNDRISNRDMAMKLATDAAMGFASDQQAKLHSVESPVYFYIYDHVAENAPYPEFIGSTHGMELSFVFGWPYFEMEENEAAYNHSGIDRIRVNYTYNDFIVSDYMMRMWTNFAKHSNPTPEAVGPGSGIVWPQLSRDNLTYAYFTIAPEVRLNYRQNYYAFWTEYLNYIVYDEEF